MLRNLYLCPFRIDLTLEKFFKNSSFCRWFGVFLQNNDNLSETSKIKELIISESRDQRPIFSGTFIYTLLALTEVSKIFSGNLSLYRLFGASVRHHANLSKTSKIQELIITSESYNQCQRYSRRFIYVLLALTKVSKNFRKIR